MSAGRRLGLGIDAGGTNTKLFVVSGSGKVVARSEIPTAPERGPADWIRRLAAAVGELESTIGRGLDAACLGVAGDVDQVRGRLRRSPNLENFEGFPLRDAMRRALRRPVSMHNDANMAGWGSYAFELKRRVPNVITIMLGTGVGGGVILNGRLYEGATGSAGEIGHMRVSAGGEPCGCGARGCLEAYAGAGGIVRIARRALRDNPRRQSLLRGEGPLEPRTIAAAAAAGDALARGVFERAARALGIGIVNVVYLFNPDAIVIAGGISRAGGLLLGPIRQALREESFRTPFGRVRIVIAKSPQLGAIGAGLYSLEGVKDS